MNDQANIIGRRSAEKELLSRYLNSNMGTRRARTYEQAVLVTFSKKNDLPTGRKTTLKTT